MYGCAVKEEVELESLFQHRSYHDGIVPRSTMVDSHRGQEDPYPIYYYAYLVMSRLLSCINCPGIYAALITARISPLTLYHLLPGSFDKLSAKEVFSAFAAPPLLPSFIPAQFRSDLNFPRVENKIVTAKIDNCDVDMLHWSPHTNTSAFCSRHMVAHVVRHSMAPLRFPYRCVGAPSPDTTRRTCRSMSGKHASLHGHLTLPTTFVLCPCLGFLVQLQANGVLSLNVGARLPRSWAATPSCPVDAAFISGFHQMLHALRFHRQRLCAPQPW